MNISRLIFRLKLDFSHLLSWFYQSRKNYSQKLLWENRFLCYNNRTLSDVLKLQINLHFQNVFLNIIQNCWAKVFVWNIHPNWVLLFLDFVQSKLNRVLLVFTDGGEKEAFSKKSCSLIVCKLANEIIRNFLDHHSEIKITQIIWIENSSSSSKRKWQESASF